MSEDDRPSPAQADRMVMTRWGINYSHTRGAKDSKKVGARDNGTALYVNELKIAPTANVGEAPESLERTLSGVAIGKSGAAHIGTFPHPKGRGGKVSALVGYGTQPKFDFTIETKDAAAAATARRDHGRLVNLLALDIKNQAFVEPIEAQQALDKLITAQFGDKDVNGTIKRVDHVTRKAANTTDLTYAPVSADRAFNLFVAIPGTAKEVSVSQTTSKNGETSTGAKVTGSKTDSHETSSNTTLETSTVQALSSRIKTGFSTLATRLRHDGFTAEIMHEHQTGTDVRVDKKFAAKGEIKGGIDLDITKLPLINKLPDAVKSILGGVKGALSFTILPDFSIDTDVTTKGLEAVMQKAGFTHRGEFGQELATVIDSEVTNSLTKTWKSVISSGFKSATSETGTGEVSGGRKDGGSTSTTVTTGSVQVVESDVQPHLIEEE